MRQDDRGTNPGAPGARSAGRYRLQAALAFLAVLPALPVAAAPLDLRNATVERLDNGLTVILLEDRRFPVASVQVLYRVGARNEVTGKTGLAHFLEHMAFRDSRNFEGTDLVSRIYAVGGEWHGYTWIDQTTYFSTVPAEELDLLLSIEADRMGRLEIAADDMEAERGAVLAEMHMYENVPASMLIDAVNFTAFQAHPYRNNTIGWESDIEKLDHEDVVDFYRQHYHPANAVIAVVGAFEPAAVRRRISELFGRFERRAPTPLPRTEEPPQNGLRRIVVHGDAGPPQFRIAWIAPSASSPDFAAFLVLQAVLGRSSGVNFLQNDWGTPVEPDAPLAAAAADVTTWYPPSAQDYVFIVGGTAPAAESTDAVEAAVEARIAAVRDLLVSESTLADAIAEVRDAFAFDVETTEDAAHQLAYFDGLGALDVLLDLPQRVAVVSAGDVRRVARRYLMPERRSIGWYLPDGQRVSPDDAQAADAAPAEPAPAPPPAPQGLEPVPEPTVARLAGGLPVVVQPSGLSDSVQVRIVFDGRVAGASAGDPVAGHSSLTWTVRSGQFDATVAEAAAAMAAAAADPPPAPGSTVPETRLEEIFEAATATAPANAPAPRPVLVVVAGDVEPAAVVARLEDAFGAIAPPAAGRAPAAGLPGSPLAVPLPVPVAQAQLGYLVAAPGPAEPAADAWRLLLYVLSHGYEGRLGRKAISEAGLAYYIDSRYRSDGTNGWVTLSTGVDPDKLPRLEALVAAELARLVTEPPTAAEVAEAKQHRLGRYVSAAQSNDELATRLATEWLWYGELLTRDALAARLDAVTEADVAAAARDFAAGTVVTVAHEPDPP